MTDERSYIESTTANLLRKLASDDAGAAWIEFVELYAPLIMSTAAQFEYEQGRVHDCFLYVCEQLNDNGFQRLLKVDTTGKATFRTWLGSVVFNLCVDWHRREYGRVTLLPAVSALPAFDQSVYRMVIEQGMDKEACFQSLRADFPDLTRELITRAVARVYALLTPRQRWQITVRNRRRQQARGSTYQESLERLPDPAMGPEREAQKRQDLERLQMAVSHLPAEQRLLLRLRFQEGLTLKKIAQLKYHGDVNVAWRKVQAATEALYQQFDRAGAAKKRKN
mgnify:FL=1